MTTLRKNAAKALVCLALALSLPAFAQATRVNIFAAIDGNLIVGKVYFSGGGVAQDIDVDVTTQDGMKAGPLKTDAKGEFFFAPQNKDTQYTFTVDTGDGHAATTTVAVGGSSKGMRPPNMAQLQGKALNPAVQLQTGSVQQLVIDPAIIASAVSLELSKQIIPLEKKLDSYKNRVLISDMLAGLGLLIGIAGFIAYLKAKKTMREIKAGNAKSPSK